MRLTEDYDDRLIAVKRRVISGGTKYTKNELIAAIKSSAKELKVVELRSGEKMFKEFVKDAYDLIKPDVRILSKKRSDKGTYKQPWNDPKILADASNEIMKVAGDVFPDGDPIDILIPKLKSWGIDERDLMPVLDAAAKKYLRVDSYNDYLVDMWDDAYGDAKFDYENWQQQDPATRGQEPGLYPSMGGEHAQNPWKPWKHNESISLKESLKEYNNKIEIAIGSILGIEESDAQQVSERLPFEEYLNVALLINKDEEDKAKEILLPYYKGQRQPMAAEAVAQKIHYLIKQKSDNIVVPEIKYLKENQQRKILSEMKLFGLQKMLANLRGYSEPGQYENNKLQKSLVEEIVQKLRSHKMGSLIEMAPGEENRQQAYGSSKPVVSNAENELEHDNELKKAKFLNDTGEEEEAEIVRQAGNSVTLKTKRGTKTVGLDKVLIPETLAEIIRIKELAGIKESRESREAEELLKAFKEGRISEMEFKKELMDIYPEASIDAIVRHASE